MINGAAYVTGARIGSGQGANHNKQIIINGAIVKLTDVNNGSGGNRRRTCNVFTLNGMDRSGGTCHDALALHQRHAVSVKMESNDILFPRKLVLKTNEVCWEEQNMMELQATGLI